MSGGVDSSVAAALLSSSQSQRQQPNRHNCHAIFMSNWNAINDDTVVQSCSSPQDWKDAQTTARVLNIPIEKVSFEKEYWIRVFEPYLQGLTHGVMGNPDMECNRQIKFGVLRDYVHNKFGSHAVLVTGHYARLWRRPTDSTRPDDLEEMLQQQQHRTDVANVLYNSNLLLLAARDTTKDQSYFLATCPLTAFTNVQFPLGDMCKTTQVRKLALDYNLPTARKRDSKGICFIGPKHYRSFVQQYLPQSTHPLQFVDIETNQIMVGHNHSDDATSQQLACAYTMGQGAKLSGQSCPYFVVHVNVADNMVHVCAGTHHPALYTDALEFQSTQPLLPGLVDLLPLRCQCRIRHLQPLIDATLIYNSNHNHPNRYRLQLDVPVRGVTLGQVAVVYVGPVVLGGGPIVNKDRSYWERQLELPQQLHPAGHNDLSVGAG